MKEKITIYDIAEQLKISAATVSRALNDHPKTSLKTKALVMQTANELGYEQNRLAVALKSGKSYNIGVIVPRTDSNFFGSIIRGIEDELYPKGYHVIICQTHEEEEKQLENIQALLNAQVDGILMSITKNTSDLTVFDRVLNKNVPLLFFDRKKDIKGVSSVTIDDFEGGYLATKHLIEQGCKKIAHFSGNQSLNIYKDRFNGYLQALKEHNIPFNPAYFLQPKNDRCGGKDAVKTLLKLEEKPDAIFSASDLVSLGAIQQLKAEGYNVPNDVCVVGFSNEPFTKFMELTISSVDQCPKDMGKIAAQELLQQINHPEIHRREKRVVLAPKLVVRNSSSKLQVL